VALITCKLVARYLRLKRFRIRQKAPLQDTRSANTGWQGRPLENRQVICRERLGGLHHRYDRDWAPRLCAGLDLSKVTAEVSAHSVVYEEVRACCLCHPAIESDHSAGHPLVFSLTARQTVRPMLEPVSLVLQDSGGSDPAPDSHHVLQTQEWQNTFRIFFNNGSYSDDDIADVFTQHLIIPFNLYKKVVIPVGECHWTRHLLMDHRRTGG
jgi:hypothetical protein